MTGAGFHWPAALPAITWHGVWPHSSPARTWQSEGLSPHGAAMLQGLSVSVWEPGERPQFLNKPSSDVWPRGKSLPLLLHD